MRRLAPCCGMLLAMLAAVAPARAQQRGEPQVLVTMFGGLSTGFAAWMIDKQPLSILGLNDPSVNDTLRLSREIQAGLSLGASATYFPSPRVGFIGEIVYLGYGLDDGCQFVYQTSAVVDSTNSQICSNIAERGGAASTFAFTLGTVYRVAPRGFASPYVRLQAGVTARSSSTVELVGEFLDPDGYTTDTRLIIADPGGSRVHPTVAGGIGVLVPVAPGYQVGLELRDNLLFVERVTGPASALAVAPTETVLKHSASLIVRFDIVLEHKRGRRY
jgi:hypothetical protein